MAIPFIVAGVAAAALGIGAKKGYDGYQNNAEAEELVGKAERIHQDAKESLEIAQEKMNERSQEIGELRLDIGQTIRTLDEMVKALLEKLDQADDSDRRFEVNIPELELKRIKAFSLSAYEFATGIASGAITGGAMAYAAYGGTLAFATASTGTAISTLSGAAATKAALASLGGGALSAGGFGVAGGTALLGGAVVAPVLAVMAWSYASKSESNLEQAKEICKEARKAASKMGEIESKLEEVSEYLYDVRVETTKLYYIFLKYYREVKTVYDLVFVKKISHEELLALSNDIQMKCNNGLGVAALLTDVAVVPLFEMESGDDSNIVALDEDNVPFINDDEVNCVLYEKGQAIRSF